jgi:hypothetical protein
MSFAMSTGPLAHVRVVDLTDLRGALAGRLLADLGADVVKVEPPGGDAERGRAPFVADVAGPERSLAFAYRHANKRGAVADVETDAGRARLAALLDGADVLLENLDRDRRARVGLDPAATAVRHPRLVHVVLADFGTTGPYAAGASKRCRRSRRAARSTRAASTTGRRAGCRDTPRTTARRVRRGRRPSPALLDRARTGRGQDGRGLRAGSGAVGPLSMGHPARRLPAPVSDDGVRAAAERGRQLLGAARRRRLRARAAGDVAALARVRAAPRLAGRALSATNGSTSRSAS